MPNRLLTINLRDYLANQPRRKRAMRVSRYIRERIAKQTNVGTDNISISKELNSIIIKEHVHSMKKLKVNINIEKGKATVTSFGAKTTAKPADTKSATDLKTAKPAAMKASDAIAQPKVAAKPAGAQTPAATKQQDVKKETTKKPEAAKTDATA
jgi:ribosomal protein L31E